MEKVLEKAKGILLEKGIQTEVVYTPKNGVKKLGLRIDTGEDVSPVVYVRSEHTLEDFVQVVEDIIKRNPPKQDDFLVNLRE